MYVAIIGDICGSRYEGSRSFFVNKYVELFPTWCRCTDDIVMTVAVADALMKSAPNKNEIRENFVNAMVFCTRKYPRAGIWQKI